VDENERGGLVGLAVGIGLGLLAMSDHNIAIGLLSVLVIVASIAWLGAYVL
jgi:hypothetical protein